MLTFPTLPTIYASIVFFDVIRSVDRRFFWPRYCIRY